MPAANEAAIPSAWGDLFAPQPQQFGGGGGGAERADGAGGMMAAAVMARQHPFGNLALDLKPCLEGEHEAAAVDGAEATTAKLLRHHQRRRQRRHGGMGQQAIDMGGIVRHLRVVPVVRMTSGGEHTRGHRRRRASAAGRQQQGVGSPALLDRLVDKNMHRVFRRSRQHHAERVDHAAPADAQSLGRKVVVADGLDKGDGLRRDGGLRNCHGANSFSWKS